MPKDWDHEAWPAKINRYVSKRYSRRNMLSGVTGTQRRTVLMNEKGSLWRLTIQNVWIMTPRAERLKNMLPEASVSMTSSAWIATWLLNGLDAVSRAHRHDKNNRTELRKGVNESPVNESPVQKANIFCITEGDCKHFIISSLQFCRRKYALRIEWSSQDCISLTPCFATTCDLISFNFDIRPQKLCSPLYHTKFEICK